MYIKVKKWTYTGKYLNEDKQISDLSGDLNTYIGENFSKFMTGASPLLAFVRMILPLALPTVAVIGLYYAVSQWNA